MQLPLLPVLPALPPLPPLPVLAVRAAKVLPDGEIVPAAVGLVPLPFEPVHSPWFPMSRNPWQHGYYEIKTLLSVVDAVTGEIGEHILPYRVMWDGREWAFAANFRRKPIAWRGLARPE